MVAISRLPRRSRRHGHGGRARIREHLMSRAQSDSPSRRVGAPPFLIPTPSISVPAESELRALKWRRAEWFAIAASILLVFSLGMLALTLSDRNALRTALASQTSLRDDARQHSIRSRRSSPARQYDCGTDGPRRIGHDTDVECVERAVRADVLGSSAQQLDVHRPQHAALKADGRISLARHDEIEDQRGTFSVRNGEAVVMARAVLSDPLAGVAVTEETEVASRSRRFDRGRRADIR